MSKHHLKGAPQARDGGTWFGWRIVGVLALLSFLLMPNGAIAQTPSAEEALDVVVRYLESELGHGFNGYLGFDAVRVARLNPDSSVDPEVHRTILARIAEGRSFPFYPGDDFGRVVCDATSNPDQPGSNCRFTHGTRQMVIVTVVSSNEDRGTAQVRAFAGSVADFATWYGSELRAGFSSRQIDLDVEYGSDGSVQIIADSALTLFRNGWTEVHQVRGAR
jgi:hypothetical protein